MSSVQKLQQARNDYQPSYEIQGQVIRAIEETNVSINLLVQILATTSVVVIPISLIVIWFYLPAYEISRILVLILGAVALYSFLIYLFLVAIWLPEWFRYRRLMKEGVLTKGVISQYVELSDLETNGLIPHIVYSFEDGRPTMQKVDRRYEIGTQIVVRYVPKMPNLSRAELSK